jgi:hypothetical protein
VPVGPETFQPVDGRQVTLWVGEGHQFPVDQIPVAGRASKAWRADSLLLASIGQWVGGASGQDQSLRHFERRETGVEVVEPAPEHGRFDAAGLGAEALMIPVAPFQGAVDEEPLDWLGCSIFLAFFYLCWEVLVKEEWVHNCFATWFRWVAS